MPVDRWPPSARDYVATIESRLEAVGFEPVDARDSLGDDVRAYRRRRVEAAKFGMLETVVALRLVSTSPTAEEVRQFSARALRFALDDKVAVLRGAGSAVLGYAVVAVESASPGLRSFLAGYRAPRHWAAFELPVVVDLSSREVLMNEATPAWGAAYYAGFRKEVRALFAPVAIESGAPPSPHAWRAASAERKRHERGQVRRLQVASAAAVVGLPLVLVGPAATALLLAISAASTTVLAAAAAVAVGTAAYVVWGLMLGLAVRAEKAFRHPP